jgi:dodecin
MPEKTFKIIELCGVSDKSYAEATKNAVAKASETLRNLDWFEVVNQRGVINDGKVAEFQVVLKVGFRLESPPTDTRIARPDFLDRVLRRARVQAERPMSGGR